MKKIKLSKEDYEFLKECKELLNEQDNRCTADPIFCIQDVERVYYCTEGDNFIYIDKEASEISFETKEEVIAFFKEEYGEIELEDGGIFDHELTINIDGVRHTFEKIGYKEISKIEQCATFSFFEKDSLEHLESNHYHYTDKARTYACSSWRSPRMNRLRKLLMELEVK